jgi:hypothetical protein
MHQGFRFHPKAIFLSWPESATLTVGSGTLTFGGWQDNAEAWCQFTTHERLQEPECAAATHTKSHQRTPDQRLPATTMWIGVSPEITVFALGFGGYVTQF